MKTKVKEHKKKGKFSPLFLIIGIILTLYALSIFFVLGWGFLNTFKHSNDFSLDRNVLGLPNPDRSKDQMAFGNYALCLEYLSVSVGTEYLTASGPVSESATVMIPEMLLNTILYAVVSAIIMAFVPAICAYVCAEYKYKFSGIMYAVNLFVITMPIVGTTVPTLTLVRTIGLYNNWIGNYILKFTFTGSYFFVYWAFYKGFSGSYSEAAEIDGASQLQILTRIIIPLSAKTITTVALLVFVGLWNDYNTPMLYMPTHPTLAYGIWRVAYSGMIGTQPPAGMTALEYGIIKRQFYGVPMKITACMILALPILIIFIIAKDKLMGNLSMGGVKE